MNCKDCFHYEACKFYTDKTKFNLPKNAENCEDFKDKSKIVELPCKVGETVYEVKFKYKCDMCSENHIEFKGAKNIDHCFNYKKEHNGNCPVKSKAWIDELKFDLSMFSLNTMKLKHNIFITKEQAEARLKELQDER